MVLASVSLYLASPGIDLWPFALVAMLPLAWLVGLERLPGPRAYLKLWLASWLGYVLLLNYLKGAHIGAAIGWPILAAYLAVYPVLFVGATRVAVHRFRCPPWLAAGIVWMGCEWIRSTLFTGFAMALLAHSVYRVPILLQVSDIAGGYGVSLLLAMWGFLIGNLFGIGLVVRPGAGPAGVSWRARAVEATVLAVSIALVVGYGISRLGVEPTARSLNVAVVQGNIDAKFPDTQEEAQAYWQGIEDQYRTGTLLVRERAPDTELVIWPESKLAVPDVFVPEDAEIDPATARGIEDAHVALEAYLVHAYGVWGYDELRQFDPYAGEDTRSYLDRFRAFIDTRDARLIPLLAGCVSQNAEDSSVYNAAVLIGEDRRVLQRYHKNHLVMFGETIPFGESLPWLYSWAPFQSGLRSGRAGVGMRVGELTLLPSICFESTVPHLLRRQCRDLAAEGQNVDVLVNVSDDSWFHGAFGLDQHLACNVFRAVELRKPMIVAANGGLSVITDGKGRIIVEAPRSEEAQVVGAVRAEALSSPYLNWIGDWPASLAGLVTVALLLVGRLRRREDIANTEAPAANV